MNDQLMDASNKGLLIDLMQYWVAMPAWWISRMLILLHEACAVVLGVVMAGALPNATVGFSGWVGPLTSALMGNWYSRALAIGMLGLGLTLMLMGSGFQLRLVQPRAFVRWSLIMVLLAIAAPSLYATTIQLVTQVPALIMPPIVETLPPITAAWITVGQDGNPVKPFDPANAAYARRAAVLAVPATASGCATHIASSTVCAHPMYTPMDAVLALWRTDRTSLISGVDGVNQTTPDGTVTVQFDGLPPDFAAMFYPDSTQPWYGGSFTSDPSGMQKRREALNTASSGTLHAVVGILAALATLMPTLAQALMTVCGALLFLLGIVVAPLGMLGNQRQWVAVVYRSFFQISGWQTVLAVGTNLATYLLFGTPTQVGIAMAYPTMLVVLPLFVWVQWRVLRFAMGLSWQGFAAVRTVVSREPLQRLLSDQPAAATEARVTATGHYTATADPAATQPTMAPSTLLRTTPMQESTATGSTAQAPSSTHTSSALPSLINPRGMVMRMQQATQRTVQRVQQLDHQIEVKEAAMLRTAEVRTDTQLDRTDQAITTMIGGKAIATGVTYVHENEVTPEWLFAPPPASTSARPTAQAPRSGQPSSAAPVARRDGDRSRMSSAAPRPTDAPTPELPTRPMPRTARPPATDLPPTQPLVSSAGRSATSEAATEGAALDAPSESNTAYPSIASIAHAPTPAPAIHATASTPPPALANRTQLDVPTPPTQELPAAAPLRSSVATPPTRAQTSAPRTPELTSNAARGPQRPPSPASSPTNGTGQSKSAAPTPVVTSTATSPSPAQPEAPTGQATPAVATATHAPMAEPAAPTVEQRTPQTPTRPARSRSRSRVGMPTEAQRNQLRIDITKEGQPAPSDPSPPAAAPLIAPRSEQRGRR
ncbi:hypothetical protein [Herpetosiphon gulosus]|uniref:Uncharacterized protein n=1 Tax=Herpetosiphon gulosus TaxID=1973496 RepID=A0ABP9X953_9CHLR